MDTQACSLIYLANVSGYEISAEKFNQIFALAPMISLNEARKWRDDEFTDSNQNGFPGKELCRVCENSSLCQSTHVDIYG